MSNLPVQASFMELYTDGSVQADQIDDFIDRWHEEAPVVMGRPVPIHEFLGMSREEYEAWVRDASILPRIRDARMSHTSLER